MNEIPSELRAMIAQVRVQYPALAGQPDEVVAALIMQALEVQQAGPAGEQNPDTMSAYELIARGEQLLDIGRWQEAEQYLLQGAEKAERENNLSSQCSAYVTLGRLCSERGDLSQAIKLYQEALALAEQAGNRRLMGVIYTQMGGAYRMQGAYPQAIVYFQ
jgi:tetratricopeptide (TPR) repeat protein